MGGFFRSFKFKIILGILAVLLGVVLYAVTQGGNTTWLSQAFGTVFNPVRQAFSAVSDKIEEGVDTIINAQQYYDENQELRAQIGALNSQLVDYEDTKEELAELRKFLGIKEEHPDFVHSAPCHLISYVTNDPYGAFVIDRGREDSISVNDPVMTGEGLVGVITEVADSYATVRTVLSPDLSIGAVCNRTKDTGIVEGNLHYAADGKTKMIYMDKAMTMQQGDLVITAGSSGLFPRGCVIGNVVETGMEESGLSAYAVIQPAVNLERITSVVVLLDFNGKGADYDN
ncbi:rod shape-determining protein MreC [Ruminococcus sp.]|uniref:rod shape-determining protein MreC n=1 Tax=Ruminococcus sp. TaxID=41978 RepID=UPI0025DCAE77|nr:rod shape-determining protein MreC [Ruminococcus sp.]MCI5815476.1 rod shape-determining protein MreC [Ruminococcus sp.]MDY4964205.1 rod shape-determining protein MreC [Ruminococcus callidus]